MGTRKMFEQKYQTFSVENFHFLKLKNSLFIARASFRNEPATPGLHDNS